jgi:NADH-quinone oxidoreductase subunit I
MFGKGLFNGLRITLQHALEADMTIQYPEEMPFLQERYRGSLVYQFEKCIACGLCITACPNRALALETFKEEGAKKKKVLRYTIERQYCMWCNLCVEICPTSTLYFSHNFELAQLRREDIKVVYNRPAGLELLPADTIKSIKDAGGEATEVTPVLTSEDIPAPMSEADSKRLKQIQAIQTALGKSPHKALAKVMEVDEDIDLLAAAIGGDERKLSKLAELMVDDRDKARKFAAALVSKAKKDAAAEGGGPA